MFQQAAVLTTIRRRTMAFLGADYSEPTCYVSASQSAFSKHDTKRPLRQRQDSNKTTGFRNAGDAPVSLVTELPRNQLLPAIAAARIEACKSSRAAVGLAKTSRSALLTSQVDCSITGAPFAGVSETFSQMTLGRRGRSETRPAEAVHMMSSFEAPRHTILNQPYPATRPCAVFEHPGAHPSAKRVSLNVARRREGTSVL